MKATYFLPLLVASLLMAPSLFAKGENEVGSKLSYFDRQSQESGEKIRTSEMGLSVLYLRSLKSLWTGVEMSYGSTRSTNTNKGHMLLGVPFKYWMKGPESKGIGLYAVATPYFGREHEGDEGSSMMGFNMGPGIVVFLSDMLGIDTKIYYDYRRVGSSPWTTTGLASGFSVYF